MTTIAAQQAIVFDFDAPVTNHPTETPQRVSRAAVATAQRQAKQPPAEAAPKMTVCPCCGYGLVPVGDKHCGFCKKVPERGRRK